MTAQERRTLSDADASAAGQLLAQLVRAWLKAGHTKAALGTNPGGSHASREDVCCDVSLHE